MPLNPACTLTTAVATTAFAYTLKNCSATAACVNTAHKLHITPK
jgi:hypothetical protein